MRYPVFYPAATAREEEARQGRDLVVKRDNKKTKRRPFHDALGSPEDGRGSSLPKWYPLNGVPVLGEDLPNWLSS